MDLDATKSPDHGVKEKTEKRGQLVDRAERRDLRIPLRYRQTEQEEWRRGETINVSESGLLFTSNELLELDARLEITFQTSGPIILQRSTRAVTIVRRVLSNWPETQVVFGVRYSS